MNLTTTPSRDGAWSFVLLDGVRTNWRLHSYLSSSGNWLWYATRFGQDYAQQMPDCMRVIKFIERQIAKGRR